MRAIVHVKRRHVRPVASGHPWVFAEAVESTEGPADDGCIADFVAPGGVFLGRGFFNSKSAIAGRVFCRDQDIDIDAFYLRRRLREAAGLRRSLPGIGFDAPGAVRANAWRLAHSEADYLPGLIVDRYGEFLVVSISTAGMERLRDLVLDLLEEEFSPKGIVLSSADTTRHAEGLETARPMVARGEAPPDPFIVEEGNLVYEAGLLHGHKTGFYLDQREHRALVRQNARGRAMLDVYCYTGGFAVAARAGGASAVVGIDSSGPALRTAVHNGARVGIPEDAWIHGQAIDEMKLLRKAGARFDLMTLDPPKFAGKRKHVGRAQRAYRQLHREGLRLLRRGGLLFSFSCSAHFGYERLRDVLHESALELGVPYRVLGRLGAPPDHPVAGFCPETEYLSGIMAVVD